MTGAEGAGLRRCFGDGPGKGFYAEYHDKEWGVPVHDDRTLFEFLLLEGAQAGLSWETILRKRSGYREAFLGFDWDAVAAMTDADLERLASDPRIVRNRLKIRAARANARAFADIRREFGSFSSYLWSGSRSEPRINSWERSSQVPVATPESEALSRDLQRRGMKFVGPTIMYSFMQAIGVVNDHLAGCWRHPSNRRRAE